jgi:hypothetical protein
LFEDVEPLRFSRAGYELFAGYTITQLPGIAPSMWLALAVAGLVSTPAAFAQNPSVMAGPALSPSRAWLEMVKITVIPGLLVPG